MSITSLSFLLFICVVLIVYYAAPKKWQWVVLLISSAAFYLSFSVKGALYPLITATTIYFASIFMDKMTKKKKEYLKANKETLSKEEKSAYKTSVKRKRKAVFVITVLVNVGLLCYFKYFHFFLNQANTVISLFSGKGITDTFVILAPLGISFYTFQSIGYLADVYWEYYKPEKNYLKMLLFVTFFPQMTQGPISDFTKLSAEIFGEHDFTYKNFSYGFQRMIWGFTKKMIVANALSVYTGKVFANYGSCSGTAALFGIFCFSVQAYADFSGYMDIMCGFCEMLGIRLTENFNRPYFSKSVAEYWRRWHISLGEWFKKYMYYTIGMSDWSRKLSKKTKPKFGKNFSEKMPATIALVITWSSTGFWHGASGAYIIWGLANGLFVILSLWLEPFYDKCKNTLKINESAFWWKVFRTIRTFCLISFIKVLPAVGTLRAGLGLCKRALTDFSLKFNISDIIKFEGISASNSYLFFALAVFGTGSMLAVSLLQRKKPVRDYIAKLPFWARIAINCAVFFLVITFGVLITFRSGNGGFMYERF